MHLSSMDSIVCLQQIDPAEQQLHGCAPSAFHHVQQPGHKTFAKTTQPRSSYMVGASDEHASPWPARDMSGFFFAVLLRHCAQKRSRSRSAMHLGYGSLIPVYDCCLSGPAAKAERDRRTHCNKSQADSGSCTSLPHKSTGSSLAFLHGLRRPQIPIQFPALWC
ncbi:unnamed protein product [Alternaria burnsii]|nr:unnamed protein product [Alternaria burnsii]